MEAQERVTVSKQPDAWNAQVLASQPDPHFMQSEAWSDIKSPDGWQPEQHSAPPRGARPAVQTFRRHAPLVGGVVHAPRVSGLTRRSIPSLTELALSTADRRVAAFKLEPYQAHDDDLVAAFVAAGWSVGATSQYRHGVTVSLAGSEDDVWMSFKSRARTDVNAAVKKNGVTAQRVPLTTENIDTLVMLIGETQDRSGAFFRSRAYLERTWRAFDARDEGRLYFAYIDGRIVAAAFVFTFGTNAWYKDGGSLRSDNNSHAARELHWKIMRDLIADGYAHYDLGNIPDPENPNEGGMRGLFQFKTGFARETNLYLPVLEYPLSKRFRRWQRHESTLVRIMFKKNKDYWY
ncbi:MAG: peptidoglycan bridge formation glycyltransferase FemA/FemB family protein [Actinobacteria bacterium]|nr:peptidoglycan bridge formation glycyltransferase FemA/FemB family protein [Actinomycetota bacterium]